MKTLKKVMAMTLAFATAMTMFVSASAFSDDADITQTEAVGMLSSLGIIKGNSDGSFAPNKNVTRGEMAKMIYVLRTGTDDGATAYSGLSTKFTDIGSTWAAPYIKYCVSQGIINGRSATTFDPDAKVTGMEAAKMLLVTIGYKADAAGLTGSSWALQTAALAAENGLFDDMGSQNMSAALTRQFAAQEIYNAIDADTVEYNNSGNVVKKETTKDVVKEVVNSKGEINTVVVSQTDNETVGEKYLKLEKTVGILKVSGNAALDGYTAQADDDALYVISDGNSVDEGTENSFTKVKTDYSDLLGQRVKVLYKKDKTDEVYGIFAMDENKVVVKGVADDMDTVSGEQKIKIDGTKYKIDDNCQYYINNKLVTPTGADAAAKAYNFADTYSNSNGKLIAVSNDDNEKIDVIRLYTKEFAQVTSVTSKGIYVGKADCDAQAYNGKTKFMFDDDDATYYKDIAKDDYVFVDQDYFADKAVITKADKVSGKVTATTSEKITINGKAYNFADHTTFSDASIGDEYTIYVDGSYAYAVDGDEAASVDSALITSIDDGYDTMSKGIKAVLLFSDGTTKDVVINKVGNTSITASNASTEIAKIPEGTLIEYDTSSNKYQVEAIMDANYKAHKYEATSKKNYDDDDATIGGVEIADDAVIYVGYYKNSDDETAKDMSYKVVTGKAFSSYSESKVNASTNSVFFQKESSGVDYVKLGKCIMNSKLSSTGDTVYGYVTATPATVKDSDDNEVTQMTLWNGTKEVTLTCDDKYSAVEKGSFVSYELVGDEAANVEVKAAATYKNAVKSYNKTTGRISFYNNLPSKLGGSNGETIDYCKLVKDSQILYMNVEDKEGLESGSIIQAHEVVDAHGAGTGTYTYNVIVVQDDDDEDEIAAIFVETDNDLGLGATTK
jgi:hypothetical protein